MEPFAVFKRYSDGSVLWLGMAETLNDGKKQIEELAKSNGHFSYFIHDFRLEREVWSWSPADDSTICN